VFDVGAACHRTLCESPQARAHSRRRRAWRRDSLHRGLAGDARDRAAGGEGSDGVRVTGSSSTPPARQGAAARSTCPVDGSPAGGAKFTRRTPREVSKTHSGHNPGRYLQQVTERVMQPQLWWVVLIWRISPGSLNPTNKLPGCSRRVICASIIGKS